MLLLRFLLKQENGLWLPTRVLLCMNGFLRW